MITSLNRIRQYENKYLPHDKDFEFLYEPPASDIISERLGINDPNTEIRISSFIRMYRNAELDYDSLLTSICSAENSERIVGFISADFAESVLYMYEEVITDYNGPRNAIDVIRNEVINDTFDETKIERACLDALKHMEYNNNEGFHPFQLAAMAANAVSLRRLTKVSELSRRAVSQYYSQGGHLISYDKISKMFLMEDISMRSELLYNRRYELYGFRHGFSSIASAAKKFELEKQLCIIEGYIL
jgi:hypothetical protein